MRCCWLPWVDCWLRGVVGELVRAGVRVVAVSTWVEWGVLVWVVVHRGLGVMSVSWLSLGCRGGVAAVDTVIGSRLRRRESGGSPPPSSLCGEP
ncbi:hypothetical protein V6N13_108934 [Hibiscus sabdariffa]|uniref:Uncharacterized protein n=1 Tax=Hibiscus sabdariffa TaxID=183260 RepID=A0ABR2FNC9_9ROSI